MNEIMDIKNGLEKFTNCTLIPKVNYSLTTPLPHSNIRGLKGKKTAFQLVHESLTRKCMNSNMILHDIISSLPQSGHSDSPSSEAREDGKKKSY